MRAAIIFVLEGFLVVALLADQPTRWNPAVSHVFVLLAGPRGQNSLRSGRVSIVEASTAREIWSIPAGEDLDATLAPDGNRLFVAGTIGADGAGAAAADYLTAYSLANGTPLWRTRLTGRVKYIDGGPSALAITPDGQDLFVYSYGPQTGSSGHATTNFWLQLVDAKTGSVKLQQILLPDCGSASLGAIPGASTLAVACFEQSNVRLINLVANLVDQTVSVLPIGNLRGAAIAADGQRLYAVSDILKVAVVDPARTAISRQVILERPDGQSETSYLALTDDGKRLVVGASVLSNVGSEPSLQLKVYDTTSWRGVASFNLDLLAPFSVTSGSIGQTVYAWGETSWRTPATPHSVVYAIDLDRQTTRPFLEEPNDTIIRVLTGPADPFP